MRVNLFVSPRLLLDEELVKVRNFLVQKMALLDFVCLVQSDRIDAGCERKRVGVSLMNFGLLLKCFLSASSLLLKRHLS
jgi:hypothetical protein